MSDPIERQAAINETLSFIVEYCGAAFDEDMQNKLYQRLILLPSAQPEIIRCLDCKYYDEVNQPYPQMYCRKHSIDTSDQDFCSYAERKDDE